MALTLTQAQTALDAWIAADLAVAKGQSYTMNGRSLTLANVKEIFGQRKVLNHHISHAPVSWNSASGQIFGHNIIDHLIFTTMIDVIFALCG